MLKQLSFDDIALFVRVAQLGTLSAAARERNVPVSQVSRALQRIEQACGVRLVHRSTHGLALTPEGEALLEHGLQLGTVLDGLEGTFAEQSSEARGRVRVAASTVIAQHLLLPSLAGLQQRHPHLQIDLEVSDRLADLARDGIDIAIRTASTLADTQVARPLGQLARALYATPGYVAEHGLPDTPQALHQHRLVTNTAAPNLNHWPFNLNGAPLRLVVDGRWRTNDTGLAANLVLQGLGIGRLATVVGQPLVAQGLLVPVLPECVDLQPAPIYAVMASARQRLPKIRACLAWWGEWFQRGM